MMNTSVKPNNSPVEYRRLSDQMYITSLVAIVAIGLFFGCLCIRAELFSGSEHDEPGDQ
ncbi:Sugar ABC transporter permease [Vibrio sp. B1FLJ16]|uniref:hypothetical protein n=1 Tax=Vibrio sp. B1FLJ16 TaxID=2751178 RepID=UPI001AF51A76|nr:hypothetical protein [Vibrio sp. B1FLJ16]CAD7804673.1 Sugar ABC transporter permease [Vibrio sp. B1FLJ16]CAE6897892.1 Sugar ABC transporter permease [Vibrio sp. B1FLJ16]